MVNFDHYEEAKKLAEELRKENLDDYAEGIIKAMEEGATGTEIFMALRWNIKKLLKRKNCPNIIKDRGNRLYKELDKALQ